MSGRFPLTVAVVPLGARAELRVTLDDFRGEPRADVRTWADYMVGPDECRGPTRKGVSLPLAKLRGLRQALDDLDAEARALGLL
jgi:hypothetical protein